MYFLSPASDNFLVECPSDCMSASADVHEYFQPEKNYNCNYE